MKDVNVVTLTDNASIPKRGSSSAAGYDLRACLPINVKTTIYNSEAVVEETILPVSIDPGETVMIGTGIAMEIPEGYFGGIYARSGLASKKGLRPANCVGVIDSDYRGEIIVALHNDSNKIQTIYNGERIAQLIIQAYEPVRFVKVDSLSDTDRGEGGFGSTGTN